MASILDRYGIKEVADVTFYELGNNGMPSNPVLYLDTLKVSTIEQTAENTSARGGKGNPELIMWDYGKEINVTLEDALFSAKSMAVMFGNGKVKNFKSASSDENAELIMRTEVFVATAAATITDEALPTEAGWKANYEAPDGKFYAKIHPKFFDEEGKEVVALEKDKKYFCTYDLKAEGAVIEISPDSFPGTYYVTGDTFARSEYGIDEFFQFVIPKAKVLSENTITMEAEGDPSVFNMSLRVLRPADGKMMKLIKYNLLEEDEVEVAADETVNLIHNHDLTAGEEAINL